MIITSDTIANLAPALVKARAAIGKLTKDTVAKGEKFSYSYATLDQLLELVTPALTANGLMVMQDVQGDRTPDGEMLIIVSTRLQHSSGEYLETSGLLSFVEDRKGLSDMQSAGMNVTYSRRYQLQALLGIAAEEDTDAGKGSSDVGRSRLAALRAGRSGYPPREERGPTPKEEDFHPGNDDPSDFGI
jgi:hypothetical protein